MRRAFLLTLAGAAAAAFVPPAKADTMDFDALLARYVSTDAIGLNRVDYAAWKANRADHGALERYILSLSGQRPSAMARPEQFAYWANLYNAATLDVVLEKYPVRSIRDIRSETGGILPAGLLGPWKQKLVVVEGANLSLDDIEHTIMRPRFADPRVHYAVNCASVGCPNLHKRAWRAETLDADLDAAARAFINSSRGIEVLEQGRSVRISRIYQWFAKDFGSAQQLRAHLSRYADGVRAAALKSGARIAGYHYDWTLNAGGNLK
jgi:hypothetical protein